jgi:hypothetical protein
MRLRNPNAQIAIAAASGRSRIDILLMTIVAALTQSGDL